MDNDNITQKGSNNVFSISGGGQNVSGGPYFSNSGDQDQGTTSQNTPKQPEEPVITTNNNLQITKDAESEVVSETTKAIGSIANLSTPSDDGKYQSPRSERDLTGSKSQQEIVKDTKDLLKAKTGKPKKISPKVLISSLVLLGILAVVGVITYMYLSGKSGLDELIEVYPDRNLESQEILDKVEKLILLPQNEEPNIITLADLEKVKGQAFFANAQTGDKVLIYPDSNKAVLYRPSIGKVISYSTVTIGGTGNSNVAGVSDLKEEGITTESGTESDSANNTDKDTDSNSNDSDKTEEESDSQDTADPSLAEVNKKPLTIAIFDKNNNIRRRTTVEADLKEELSNYEVEFIVLTKVDADFEKNTVIPLGGVGSGVINDIADTVNGEITSNLTYGLDLDAEIFVAVTE